MTNHRTNHRRVLAALGRTVAATAVSAAALATIGAGTAAAFEPPGEAAKDNFGCIETDEGPVSHPVLGHPGANGVSHANPIVAENTGNPRPTAWNASDRSSQINDGTC